MSELTLQKAPPVEAPARRPAPRRHRRRQLALHAGLLFGVLIVLFPFAWFVTVAIRPETQQFQLWPSSFTLSNFAEMVHRVPQMVSFYQDSVIITAGSVALTTLVSTLSGYAFARLDFPLRNTIFWAVVITTFIPPATAIASLYLEMVSLRLVDTRIGLILVYAAWDLGIGTFIMRTVFAAIPRELEEAARIDGASIWWILWKIMVPLSAGGMVVVALLDFIYVWGEYMFAFTLAGTNVRPMSIGIQLFQTSAADPRYTFNVAAAAALVMFIPSIVIYIVFQKWFTKGLMEGALKG